MTIDKITLLTTFCTIILLQWSCISDNQSGKTDKGSAKAVENWEKVIVGTWKYNMLLDKAREKQVFEGEIEYKNDGTFTRTVTIFVHFTDNGEVTISKGWEKIISGGTIKGKWKVYDNKLLVEDLELCTISNSFLASDANKKYDGCAYFLEFTLGDKQTDDWKGELLEFSEKSMRAQSKQFSSGALITYEATK